VELSASSIIVYKLGKQAYKLDKNGKNLNPFAPLVSYRSKYYGF
jgi:hypothetical protein